MVRLNAVLLTGLALGATGCLNTGACGVWYVDADQDGYTAAVEGTYDRVNATLICVPPAGALGQASEMLDCDDADTGVNPGVAADGLMSDGSASCDGVDQDCDGVADEDAPTAEWFVDGDGDGYGAGGTAALSACEEHPGYVEVDGDCDDSDEAVSPDAEQTECGPAAVDVDCDGVTDCAVQGAVDAAEATRWEGATAAAAVGDLDGDGLMDLVLGEPGDGQIRVVSGPVDDAVGEVVSGEGDFGTSLAAGDFDGDGAVELAVGAPGAVDGDGEVVLLGGARLNGEEATLGAGSASGLGTALATTPGRAGGAAGLVVTTVASLEGDPYNSAWVVAAPMSAGALTSSMKIASYPVQDGWPAALAGAADGSEIAVGYTKGSSSAAEIFSLPFTSGDTSDGTVGADTDALLGAAVTLADLNGARGADLLVGAPGAGEVQAYLDLSGAAGDADLSWRAAADHAGSAVAVVGDMTGDGLDELVIGGDGVAWVLFGTADGFAEGELDDIADARVSGLSGSVRAITSPGDLDADGYDELLLTDESGTTLLWGGP